jgi:hypothetical protein
MGIDVFGRGTYAGGQLNCNVAAAAARREGGSRPLSVSAPPLADCHSCRLLPSRRKAVCRPLSLAMHRAVGGALRTRLGVRGRGQHGDVAAAQRGALVQSWNSFGPAALPHPLHALCDGILVRLWHSSVPPGVLKHNLGAQMDAATMSAPSQPGTLVCEACPVLDSSAVLLPEC